MVALVANDAAQKPSESGSRTRADERPRPRGGGTAGHANRRGKAQSQQERRSQGPCSSGLGDRLSRHVLVTSFLFRSLSINLLYARNDLNMFLLDDSSMIPSGGHWERSRLPIRLWLTSILHAAHQ
jgi:hypothetical protein